MIAFDILETVGGGELLFKYNYSKSKTWKYSQFSFVPLFSYQDSFLSADFPSLTPQSDHNIIRTKITSDMFLYLILLQNVLLCFVAYQFEMLILYFSPSFHSM